MFQGVGARIVSELRKLWIFGTCLTGGSIGSIQSFGDFIDFDLPDEVRKGGVPVEVENVGVLRALVNLEDRQELGVDDKPPPEAACEATRQSVVRNRGSSHDVIDEFVVTPVK